MPVVQNTLLDPSGNPVAGAKVQARLAVSSSTRVYRPATTVSYDSIVSTTTNAAGLWQLTLVANSLLTPAGTAYEIREANPVLETKHYTVVVPNGAGPYWVTDIEVDPPGALPSGALSDHLGDGGDAHDAASISVASGAGVSATDVQAAIAELAASSGGGGVAGSVPLFVQDSAPTAPGNYMWVETGLGAGTDWTIWIEDGI
jgi:hypothetical protein